jgi:hypothetical protein
LQTLQFATTSLGIKKCNPCIKNTFYSDQNVCRYEAFLPLSSLPQLVFDKILIYANHLLLYNIRHHLLQESFLLSL